MKPLKISITGVRGIVGETFTPEVAVGFAQAFATYLDSGRILVCRDTRLSGPMVRSAVVAGLLAGSRDNRSWDLSDTQPAISCSLARG